MSRGSPGGVFRFAGVVAMEDSLEERKPGREATGCSRCWAASSAASFSDIAELFLPVDLNWKRDLGANFDRVS